MTNERIEELKKEIVEEKEKELKSFSNPEQEEYEWVVKIVKQVKKENEPGGEE